MAEHEAYNIAQIQINPEGHRHLFIVTIMLFQSLVVAALAASAQAGWAILQPGTTILSAKDSKQVSRPRKQSAYPS